MFDYLFFRWYNYNKQRGLFMNPFKVNKVIREKNKNDVQICVDTLSELCGGRIKHAFLRMSDQTFLCEECGGFPRHWVEGLRLHSWFTMWLYHPERIQDHPKSALYEDIQYINSNG